MTNIKTQDKTAFGRTLTDKDIVCLQMLGLQVNGINYVNQLQLVGV